MIEVIYKHIDIYVYIIVNVTVKEKKIDTEKEKELEKVRSIFVHKFELKIIKISKSSK